MNSVYEFINGLLIIFKCVPYTLINISNVNMIIVLSKNKVRTLGL